MHEPIEYDPAECEGPDEEDWRDWDGDSDPESTPDDHGRDPGGY